MCLGHKSWVAWLDIRGNEEARGRGRRKIEERRKKREKEGRRKGSTETVATRSFHGVRKDAATLSFRCSEDECKENARVWDGARTCARTHGTRGSYARGHRAHRFDRNRSSPVEARPVSARLLSLSHERAVSACINARTRRREHARKVEAKARQSVDALMWPPPPLPSPPWIPLYLALVLSLFVYHAFSIAYQRPPLASSDYFVVAPRSRLRSAIHLGVLADWTSPPVETAERDDTPGLPSHTINSLFFPLFDSPTNLDSWETRIIFFDGWTRKFWRSEIPSEI